jgi:hypothetical protein
MSELNNQYPSRGKEKRGKGEGGGRKKEDVEGKGERKGAGV